MKTIPLTRGFFATVDDKDYWGLAIHRWQSTIGNRGKVLPTRTTNVDSKRTTVYMSREIMGADVGKYVDHINGDTLDNRRINLRLCTNAENLSNRGKPRNNTSGYKGVVYDKRRNKWYAYIGCESKGFRSKDFDSRKDAAQAYDKLALEKHGDFAKLNFPLREGNLKGKS